MLIESPTRREIWLAVFLLVSLLFISRSRSDLNLPRSVRAGPEDNLPTQNSTYLEHGIAPQLLRDRVRWASQVPQTKIVAHVPGELCLMPKHNLELM
jgi:hypothetical protein